MMIRNWFLKFCGFCLTVRDWVRYYLGFSKAALFVMTLVFSHSVVEYAVLFILIDYFKDIWGEKLPKAAAMVNVKEGLTAVMVIVCAYISDTYLCRFKTLLLSNLSYVIGLVLLWISAFKFLPNVEHSVFFMGLVLVAIGEAAREPPLKAFFADQFKEQDDDKERAEVRAKVWWRFARLLGIITAIMALPDWPNNIIISATIMSAAYVVFLCGTNFYSCIKPTGSPLTNVFKVLVVATLRRRLDHPLDATQLYEKHNLENVDQTKFPHTSRFRWLDRAATIDLSSRSQEQQERNWRPCTVIQVEESKLLLGMIPMWATFLLYSLVKSTGSTFFIEQATSLNDHFNTDVPIGSLYVIKTFSNFAISKLYELLSNRLTESQQRYATRVRIGVGMCFSILCCSIASQVETRRLNIINYNKKHILQDHKSMGIFWLAPQFCLLGVMEGLAEDGLRDFFYDQVSESMEGYGPQFNDCVIGLGNLLSVFCVLASRSLFSDTLDSSRLDKYYRMLTIFSFVNLGFYCYISSTYPYKVSTSNEVELETVPGANAQESA